MTGLEDTPPSETVVNRLFRHDLIDHDLFSIEVDGRPVATVDYATASDYWTGRKSLVEIVGRHALRRQNEQSEGVKLEGE